MCKKAKHVNGVKAYAANQISHSILDRCCTSFILKRDCLHPTLVATSSGIEYAKAKIDKYVLNSISLRLEVKKGRGHEICRSRSFITVIETDRPPPTTHTIIPVFSHLQQHHMHVMTSVIMMTWPGTWMQTQLKWTWKTSALRIFILFLPLYQPCAVENSRYQFSVIQCLSFRHVKQMQLIMHYKYGLNDVTCKVMCLYTTFQY